MSMTVLYQNTLKLSIDLLSGLFSLLQVRHFTQYLHVFRTMARICKFQSEKAVKFQTNIGFTTQNEPNLESIKIDCTIINL